MHSRSFGTSSSWICAPLNHQLLPDLQWVEATSFFQIPSLQVVGLPSREVTEARERIRSAIDSSGIEFPRRRVILNLSPANIKKRGTGLDLAMSLAVLATTLKGSLSERVRQQTCLAWGELGLDGTVKPVGQTLRALIAASRAQVSSVLLSEADCETAARQLQRFQPWLGASDSITLVPVRNLQDAWKWITEPENRKPFSSPENGPKNGPENGPAEVEPSHSLLLPISAGLERILGIAASGQHHLLLLGPKGVGKSQALEWLIRIFPAIHSESRLLQALIRELKFPGEDPGSEDVPVRRISPQIRPAGLCGSADPSGILPGEFSMAHGGLLIADEFPEWATDSRECLREPMERGRVMLNRTHISAELPAEFTLAATGNLCPCGGWPSELVPPENGRIDPSIEPCLCSPGKKRQYGLRISGPVCDRIGMILRIGGISGQTSSASLSELRGRVAKTHAQLIERFGTPPGRWTGEQVERALGANPDLAELIEKTPQTSVQASLRARHHLIRLAFTISAWDGLDQPGESQLLEAASYRIHTGR